MLEEFSEYFRNLELEDPDSTCGTSDYDTSFDNDPDDCYCESDKTRYNDKGDSVPDKCPKCGSKIEVYLKGEPVYLCSNKECGKYYGTVPCNINESENPSETEMFYKRWKEKEGVAALKQVKEIVKKIAKKVEEDEQPPCGNQNCKLCTWCVEAQFRDINALPRPVYSPRDPALAIKGETIVKDPKRISIQTGYDDMLDYLMEPVANVARFYCHVNWNNSTGGHEFIILKIGKQNFFIVDAQAGIVEPLSDTGNYFNDINFANSFICRLDNRDFNKELFEKYNDPKSVVPWDGRLDIPYMLEHGMLSEEEAEQYWKEHPDEAPNDRHFLSYEELDRMSESKNIFTSGDFVKYADGVDLDAARRPIQEGFFGPSSMKIHNTIEAAIKLPDDYRTQLFSSVNGKPMISQYDNKKIDSVSTISHWLTPREIYDDIVQRRIQTNIPKITIAKLKPSGTLSIHNGDENIYINTTGSDERFDKSFGTFTELINAINADQPVKVVIDGYMNENQLYDEYGGRGVLSDFFKIYSDRKFYSLINNFNRLQMSNNPEKHYSKDLRKAAEKIFRDPTEDERNGRVKYFMHPDDLFTDSDGNDYGIGFAGVDNADEYLAISCKDGKVYYMSCGNPDRLVSNSFIDFLKSFEDGFFDEYLSKPIQEVWNDIKNGVNPYSKKLWFHVSRSDKHEGKVFTPRVPDYLYTQEELGKDDPYYEDMTIPRICFSPSIEGALHAIISMGDRIGTAGEEFYVYIPEKPINEYKHMTNKEIVDKKLVFDAKYTKECWITEPVKLILYGSIVIDQVYNHRAKPTANGKSNVGVVSYKWHWQTKPQVVKGTGHEAFAWNEEPKQKSKKKSKSIKEAFEMSVLERDPNVIKMFLESEKDDDNEDTSTDITVTDVEIGADDGTGEQNQYDPEEVEYLNHLIAAEAEAISDYFEGGKKTKVPVLSKLYSDIGEEERFHLEQLIYAKSTITGEKYEPKDPDVRKEYEELLELGMDEQTAMTTAVDKLSISVKEEEPDSDMTDEEIDDVKESFELIYSVSQSTSLQTQIMLESVIDQKQIRKDIIESTNAFFEQVFIMEEVSNLNTKAGQNELGSKNPIVMILKAISGIYRLVISLVKKAKLAFQKTRLKSKAKWAWIKKHGIKGLFADGVSMYFYSDKKMKYDIGDALKYLKLINDTCDIIIRDTGIKNVDQNKYKIDKYIEKLKASTPDVDSFTINTLDEGISKLNGSNLFKVKMIVNDNNEKEIEEQFFGYTEKNFLAITKEGENSKQINLSNNIYNKMDIILNAFNLCTAKSVEIATGLNALSEKPNTIFQSNPKLFNKCVSALSVISKSLNKFTSAVSSDLASMMNLNKGLNELARRYEETHSREDKQKLGEYTKGRADAKQQADAAEKSNDKTQSKYNV